MSEDSSPSRVSAENLEQLGSVLFSEHTLDDLLQLVVILARRTVGGADGVSVSISRDGKLLTSNASDEVVRELDNVQYQLAEGPCFEALRRGHPTTVELELDSSRYPRFAEAAQRRFFTAVMSQPLTIGERVIGALNFYSGSVLRFGGEENEVAGLFARQASIMLENGLAFLSSANLNETLRDALATREVIGEAKGIIMVQQRCSPDEAFDHLRKLSQRENRKLRLIAEEIVAGVQRGPRQGSASP